MEVNSCSGKARKWNGGDMLRDLSGRDKRKEKWTYTVEARKWKEVREWEVDGWQFFSH